MDVHVPVRGSGAAPRVSTASAHTGVGPDKSRPAAGDLVVGEPGPVSCALRLKSTSLYLMADYGVTNEIRRARPFPNQIMAEGIGNSTLDGQWDIIAL